MCADTNKMLIPQSYNVPHKVVMRNNGDLISAPANEKYKNKHFN